MDTKDIARAASQIVGIYSFGKIKAIFIDADDKVASTACSHESSHEIDDYLHRESRVSLNSIESLLPADKYVRINRQAISRTADIYKIERIGPRRFRVWTYWHNKPLLVARRRIKAIEKALPSKLWQGLE